jgi:hypothetical protein
MSPAPYSASQQDLYYPASSLESFPEQRPQTDAELCAWMCLLAYCDQFPNFAFDRDTIKLKLSSLGFQSVTFFESQGHDRNGGTHCFLAIHDDEQEENKLAVVSFRGTDKDDPTDLLDDAEALLVEWQGAGKVFVGFESALAEVQRELLAAINPITYRMLYTGHSLGAALATLLAAVKAPSALYTIGSPRVGNQDFVESLAALKNSRYVDCCDAVTELPPEILGYAHLGPPIYISQNRRVSNSPGDDSMAADRMRARADYLVHYAWKRGDVCVRDLADHAPINYVTAIAAANT